jgi:hypothetical protein
VFPVTTTTELTRNSLILFAATETGSEGDTTASLNVREKIINRIKLNIFLNTSVLELKHTLYSHLQWCLGMA